MNRVWNFFKSRPEFEFGLLVNIIRGEGVEQAYNFVVEKLIEPLHSHMNTFFILLTFI
jgi:hypothetical protein